MEKKDEGAEMIITNKGRTFVIVLVYSVLSSGGITKADIYDLSANWSDSSNPNGMWSYYVNNTLGQSSTRIVVDDTDENNDDNFATNPGAPPIWTTDPGSSGYGYVGWSQSNGSEPSYWDLEAGDVYGYTSPLGIEIRWTSPVNGPIHIEGGIWTARDFGDPDRHKNTWTLFNNTGEDIEILHTDVVYVGDPYNRSSPAPFDFDRYVNAGDVIWFFVEGSSLGTPNYIALDLEISVVPVPGSVFLCMLGLGVAGRKLHRSA